MLPQRNSLLWNNRLLYPLSSAKVDIFFHPSTITSAFNHGSLPKELWRLLFLASKYTPLYSIQWMQMSSLFLSLSFYGLRLVLIDQSKYLCLSGKRYIGFTQEVYTFQSIGIYVSFGRYIPFSMLCIQHVMRKIWPFGSSVDKKDIGSGYFLLLQPMIALPQWASAHNE